MEPIEKAIAFIEKGLLDDLSIDDIAESAHLSPFHFSRMFKAVTGLSVMGYVQRRRLSSAAERILKDDIKLIDIALDYRFNSHEAFSRAFKKAFGISPASYKKSVKPVRLHYLDKIDSNTLEHLSKGISLEPKIIERDSFYVIGMKEEFDDENKDLMPNLWKSFAPRIPEINGQKGNELYGICECSNIYESDFFYSASVLCEEDAEVAEGMCKLKVPQSKYAVFEHVVRDSNLHNDLLASIKYIWGTWIPRSKYSYTGTPDFELYGERFNFGSMTGIIELYIPVE